MAGMLAAFLATMSRQPITGTPNWGSDSVAHPSAKNSTNTLTFTVPATSLGAVTLTATTNTLTGATLQYILSGGSNTTWTSPTDITVVNGDTLVLRVSNSGSAAGSLVVTVTDKVFGSTIGTWTLTVT